MKKLTIDRLIDEMFYGYESVEQGIRIITDKLPNTEYSKLCRTFIESLNNIEDWGQRADFAHLMALTFNFCKYGRIIYAPSPELTAAIVKTGIADIKMSHLILPYQAFYVKLPVGAYTMTGVNGAEMEVEGVILYHDDNMFYFSYISNNIELPGDDFGYNMFNMFGNIPDGNTTIGEYIGWTFPDDGHTTDQMASAARDMMEFMFGFLIYAHHAADFCEAFIDQEYIETQRKHQDAKAPGKKDRHYRRMQRLSPSKVKVIAPHRRYINKFREDATTGDRVGERQSGKRKPMGFHIVGLETFGFWREQAHGKNFNKRKLIWIAPFARGTVQTDKNTEIKVR